MSSRRAWATPPSPRATSRQRAGAANARIHELSHTNAEHAGMGTTLTAVYVAPEEIAIAHVGDSRAYRLRDGELMRLTDDHSLVDELMRQGKITPEEAVDHPQRSVITRALGPEPSVEIDTRSYSARTGDVYLLCSDGLTTMLPEERLAEIMRSHPRLRDAGEALIAAANEAGGRDNITVVLFRLEDPSAPAIPAEPATEEQTALAPFTPSTPLTAERPRHLDPPSHRRPPAAAARRATPARRPVRGCRSHPRRGRRCDRAARACPRQAGGRAAQAPARSTRSWAGGDRAGRARPDRRRRVSGARSRSTSSAPTPAAWSRSIAACPTSCPAGSSCTAATTSQASARRRCRPRAGARCSTTRCARKPTRPVSCAAWNWGSSGE